jgi:hypothetical protein
VTPSVVDSNAAPLTVDNAVEGEPVRGFHGLVADVARGRQGRYRGQQRSLSSLSRARAANSLARDALSCVRPASSLTALQLITWAATRAMSCALSFLRQLCRQG